ncbi:hypothetical protein TNCV_1329601 [Trichonephila clavipes]|nr:hypothetical protein TNCV_1329601 [Trichonephila clavipes]
MDKCVQMLDKNHGTLSFQTARECICVLSMSKTRETEGRLLWPANEKGRGAWCGPTLVFKKVFLGDERRALKKKETWALENERL